MRNRLPNEELDYIEFQLSSLSLRSLAEYYQSDWWKFRRKWYRQSTGFSSCGKCGKKGKLELHHRTYKHLGCEPDEDLQLLCENCHRVLHKRMTRRVMKGRFNHKRQETIIFRGKWKRVHRLQKGKVGRKANKARIYDLNEHAHFPVTTYSL